MRRSDICRLFVLLMWMLAACKNHEQAKTVNADTAAQTKNQSVNKTPKDSTAQMVNNKPADTNAKAGEDTGKEAFLAGMQAMSKHAGKDSSMAGMMAKVQAMMGGKKGNPGNAISQMIMKMQLGQMKDGNPLKDVAQNKLKAQNDGTAAPSKTYTAKYNPEQATGYIIPVTGNGNGLVLQYTGGSVGNGKKDGAWKNISLSTASDADWNIYSEGYAESSALNMKVHSVSLANKNKSYSIILSDQYQKFAQLPHSDAGKNESGFSVVKLADEKLYGYNCSHIKMKYTMAALGQTAHFETEEWYSAGAPGADLLSAQIFENHQQAAVQKIAGLNCKGVLIKSLTQSGNTTQLIQLTSIIKKDIPTTLFKLPGSYQEDKNTALYSIQ